MHSHSKLKANKSTKTLGELRAGVHRLFTMEEHQNEKLWELIKGRRTGFLVTKGGEFMRGRPMAILQDGFNGSLWFLTSIRSTKADEIEASPEVCVTFTEEKDSTYVSVTGQATLSQDRNKIDQLWTHETGAFFQGGKDDPDLGVLQVRVTHAEYWDIKASRMIQFFEFVKANITGEHPDLGENRKFN